MTIDLTGGLDDEREFVFAAQPPDPDMRESVNVWMWDDGDEFGLPRVAIEAVADQWDTHDLQVNIAFADGRVLQIFEPGEVHDPLGADGRPRDPRRRGAGVRVGRAVPALADAPRRHAIDTTVDAQIDALRSRS